MWHPQYKSWFNSPNFLLGKLHCKIELKLSKSGIGLLRLGLDTNEKELTGIFSSKDHMVNFPVLFHAYNLVTSPYERAVIQTQKFGDLEYIQ